MKTLFLWVGGFAVAFVLFGFAMRAIDPKTAAKDSARASIASCQKSQDDSLAPMNARRLARDTCDMMRGEFSKQYGFNP